MCVAPAHVHRCSGVVFCCLAHASNRQGTRQFLWTGPGEGVSGARESRSTRAVLPDPSVRPWCNTGE
eukprot:1389963-Alexandrium_andersonii.AAC.1